MSQLPSPEGDPMEPDKAAQRARARGPGKPPASPAELRAAFWRWGRVAFVLIALWLAVQLLLMLGGIVAAVLSVLLYVVFGGVVALIVAPLDRLLRRALPPPAAALLALLSLFVVLGGLGYLVGVPVAAQARSLTHALPRLEQPFIHFQQFLLQHGINVSLGTVANVLGIKVSGASSGAALLSAASITVRLMVDLFITLITAFWLLNDRNVLRRGLLSVLPGSWRTEADFLINAFVVVFGGYLRGQLFLAGLIGVLAGLGCYLLHVPFALVVGVSAGVFELIPLAGPFVGAGVGALFAFTVSPVLALEVLGLFLAIHVLEGYIISPRIQARFVRLHPLITLLALLAGIGAGGFLGAFFAVPVASLLAVVFRARIADLQASQPQLFTLSPSDMAARGRRRSLLAEYRVRPGAVLKRVGRRVGKLAKRVHAAALLPVAVALGALAVLLVYANPARIGAALARFNLAYLPIVVALSLGFYVLQGVRWWTLNRGAGIRFPLRQTVLLTEAGQATALLPLGELSRALLLSRAARVAFGRVLATETVQELLFVFMLFAAALPAATSYHFVVIAIALPMLLIIGIVAVLTSRRLYARVRQVVGRMPLLRRARPAVDDLQRTARVLFRERTTYVWLPLSALQAVMAVSLLWMIAAAVAPGRLGWTSAGCIYAVTQGAAWLSFSPGGLGAVEASTAGLLVALGFSFDVATAVAVLQRLADKVLNGLVGWACYAVARRRYGFRVGALLDLRRLPAPGEVSSVAV